MRGGLGVRGQWRYHSPPSTPTATVIGCWEHQCVTGAGGVGGEVREGVTGNRIRVLVRRYKEGGPVVPKGTLRAPVSPFQTTVWHYGNNRQGDTQGGWADGAPRTFTKKREQWKKRRRLGEQTDNHRRPQATRTRISH